MAHAREWRLGLGMPRHQGNMLGNGTIAREHKFGNYGISRYNCDGLEANCTQLVLKLKLKGILT
jgi:hypothetical protein